MLKQSLPLVSVIIPTKGCSDTIVRAINSVLSQNYFNVECINVDFPLDDNATFKVVESNFAKDGRVKYLKSDIAGLAYQRNLGVKNATGEFIVFLDGDDTLEKNYISKMHEAYVKTKCDMVCCSYKRVSGVNGEQKEEKVYFKTKTHSNIGVLKKLYSKAHTCLSICGCKFAKKELYFKIPINEHILNEDEATTYKHFLACKSITLLNDRLYNYFYYDRETLSSSHLKRLEIQVDGLLNVYKERYGLFLQTKNRYLIFKSYYELLSQSLSYAFVFKKKGNDYQSEKCLSIYKDNFKLRKLVFHPFKLVKLLLKVERAKI